MVHCAALFLRFRAKISNKHKNYLYTVLVTGASASAQVLLFWGPVPLWHPNREIPPHPRSSFSFDILLFRQGHMKRRVVKPGTGSQNVIYNIGAVGLHKEHRVKGRVFCSGMLSTSKFGNTVADRFWTLVRLLSIKQCMA